MISLGERGGWTAPVLRTVAVRGEGVDEVVAALDAHRQWSDGSGERERRRIARAEAEIEAVVVARLRARIGDVHGRAGLSDLAKRVVAGELDPYAAADELEPGPCRSRAATGLSASGCSGLSVGRVSVNGVGATGRQLR